MQFAAPQMLWLLVVIPPALWLFFWWAGRRRQARLTQFIHARLLPGLLAGLSVGRRKIGQACLVLAAACMIVALARPQWGFSWQEVTQRGVDIVVAIDTSKSMLATDIAPNRLARARLAALDLMLLAKTDRLGLVAFAGTAFLQCPLTIDDVAFRQSVESLDVTTLPQGGTALTPAIEAALTAFKEGDNHKILVLMTDGEDHDSNALEAAKKASAAGLRIYTIGVGTAEGDLLRVKDAQGKEDYVRDEQGNVVKSRLNEQLLQEIAGATEGGFYLPLRGAKTIDTLYAEGLAKLPKSEHQQKLVKQYTEQYRWPLGLGILLLLVEWLLPERPRQPGRRPASPARGRGALAVAAGLMLLTLPPSVGLGSPRSALREYKAGKYEDSLKEYEKLLEKKGDDPRLHFNAGAAAYRSRQFGEAARQFNSAVATPDLKLQQLAYYNRGNSHYHLGETNPDPAQRAESWEKALKDYDLSLKLNPEDADAKFNQQFVKRKLEELKQQQQQQQNQSDDQNKQDQDQQEQQQQQDQQRQQQQQQQQNRDDSSEQNPEEQEQPQRAESEPQDRGQDRERQQQSRPQEQQGRSAQPQEQKEGEEQKAAAAGGQEMTAEQAKQLLEAAKAEESMLPLKPEGQPPDPQRPRRDW